MYWYGVDDESLEKLQEVNELPLKSRNPREIKEQIHLELEKLITLLHLLPSLPRPLRSWHFWSFSWSD